MTWGNRLVTGLRYSVTLFSGVACEEYTCSDRADCVATDSADAGHSAHGAPQSSSAHSSQESDASRSDRNELGSSNAETSDPESSGIQGSDDRTEQTETSSSGERGSSGDSGGETEGGDSHEVPAVSDAGSGASDSCSGGSFWSSDADVCVPWTACPVGTYISQSGGADYDRQCSACSAGSYADQVDQESCAACRDCAWLGAVADCSATANAQCGETDATRQLGTAGIESGRALAFSSSGQLWAVGSTTRALEGTNVGATDAIAVQYAGDGSGYELDQFGTTNVDESAAVASDSNGNVWIVGTTEASLDGRHYGGVDVFLRRYDSQRVLTQSHQFGSATLDVGTGVAIGPDGDVWVVGYTDGALTGSNAGGTDVFLRRFPADGAAPQSFQFGTTAAETAKGVAVDETGTVWVVGSSGSQALLLRIPGGDASQVETHLFGEGEYNVASAVAATSAGVVWVVGTTTGALTGASAGGRDAFARRYALDGTALETLQFGTGEEEEATAVTTDKSGDVWVAGYTSGSLGSRANSGSYDGFARRYPASGGTPATYQFGADGNNDFVYGATTDGGGNVWVVGTTTAGLEGGNQGREDLFVRQVAWQ